MEFMPHGHCFYWLPSILIPYVLSSFIIGGVYIYLSLSGNWHKNSATIYLFKSFIGLCGVTHILKIMVIWWPFYRLMVTVDMVTAAVSLVAVVVMKKNGHEILAVIKDD